MASRSPTGWARHRNTAVSLVSGRAKARSSTKSVCPRRGLARGHGGQKLRQPQGRERHHQKAEQPGHRAAQRRARTSRHRPGIDRTYEHQRRKDGQRQHSDIEQPGRVHHPVEAVEPVGIYQVTGEPRQDQPALGPATPQSRVQRQKRQRGGARDRVLAPGARAQMVGNGGVGVGEHQRRRDGGQRQHGGRVRQAQKKGRGGGGDHVRTRRG